MAETGTVKKFMDDKGFGFIAPDDGGEELFVHIKQCRNAASLREGDSVSYDRQWNDRKGKYNAENCTVTSGGGENGSCAGCAWSGGDKWSHEAAKAEWEPVQLQTVDWTVVTRPTFQRVFLKPTHSPQSLRREALGIRIEDDAGAAIPAPIENFSELDVLPEYVSWGLAEHNISTPMPIQAQALPLVLGGNDVIGLAQTGSGKTLAFLIPAVVHVEAQEPLVRQAPTPIVLVLAPTRELAVQISDEAGKVLRHSKHGRHNHGVGAVVLYGGGNKREQQKNLSWGAHIVVATPGRLIDFIATKYVSLERVTYFVLDEADRMLDMGFSGDVASIAAQVRPERQVLFFSATWSHDVQVLAHGLCQQGSCPVRISVGQSHAGDSNEHQATAREGIVQEVVVVDEKGDYEKQKVVKDALLDRYLEQTLAESEDHKVLVFVSQKQFADDLCAKLDAKGHKVGAMHGGRAQETRLWVLDEFRQGRLQLLVATDVLGRGIDLPLVSHVVVYDMGSIDDYVHRIGRTARGKQGTGRALVFFEYYYKASGLAAELIALLEGSKQIVPPDLRQIALEVARGEREVFAPNAKWGKSGSGSWKNGTSWSDGKSEERWKPDRPAMHDIAGNERNSGYGSLGLKAGSWNDGGGEAAHPPLGAHALVARAADPPDSWDDE